MSGTVVITGNPRPGSRTLAAATVLGHRLAALAGTAQPAVYDLAEFGPRLFDADDAGVIEALARLRSAEVAVVASPTYKASFSGLLKLFLDRIPAGALERTVAVPLMTGGSAQHSLAVDVHLRPVLLELGAVMPARSIYLAESQLPELEAVLDHWQLSNAHALAALRLVNR